jgi:hypothetical protein
MCACTRPYTKPHEGTQNHMKIDWQTQPNPLQYCISLSLPAQPTQSLCLFLHTHTHTHTIITTQACEISCKKGTPLASSSNPAARAKSLRSYKPQTPIWPHWERFYAHAWHRTGAATPPWCLGALFCDLPRAWRSRPALLFALMRPLLCGLSVSRPAQGVYVRVCVCVCVCVRLI